MRVMQQQNVDLLFVVAVRLQADLEKAEAGDDSELVTEAPVDQPENEDRPESVDAHNDSKTQQPLPGQKKEEGKYIPSKKNQNDL